MTHRKHTHTHTHTCASAHRQGSVQCSINCRWRPRLLATCACKGKESKEHAALQRGVLTRCVLPIRARVCDYNLCAGRYWRGSPGGGLAPVIGVGADGRPPYWLTPAYWLPPYCLGAPPEYMTQLQGERPSEIECGSTIILQPFSPCVTF